MSQHHITLQGDFFHPPPQPELHELTASSQPHRPEGLLQRSPNSSASGELRFFEEYKRIHMVAFSLQAEKKRVQAELEGVLARLRAIEGRLGTQEIRREGRTPPQSLRKQEHSSQDNNRSKRSRRTAEQIQKKHQCHAHQCERYYGSEGSLQQHIKLKHPELLKIQDGQEDSDDNEGSQFMPVD